MLLLKPALTFYILPSPTNVHNSFTLLNFVIFWKCSRNLKAVKDVATKSVFLFIVFQFSIVIDLVTIINLLCHVYNCYSKKYQGTCMIKECMTYDSRVIPLRKWKRKLNRYLGQECF